MESSPSNSIERQIDNFLEHFKRSASKAMEADWTGSGSATGSGPSCGSDAASASGVNVATPSTNGTIGNGLGIGNGAIGGPGLPQHQQLQRTKSRSSCLDISELSGQAPPSQADSDKQLFSTLCEIDKHNYLYLFERCKACNVNARQLRYFEKEHVRDLIPPTNLGVLVEFEFLLSEWRDRNGFHRASTAVQVETTLGTPVKRTILASAVSVGTMTTPIATQTRGVQTALAPEPANTGAASTLPEVAGEAAGGRAIKCDDDQSQSSLASSPRAGFEGADFCPSNNYPLAQIIPTVLRKCQQKYQANRGLLTEIERRMLSAAIIDYFISRSIHLTAATIENLAEQISQHFPTESKRAWYDRKNCKGRGRLYVKLYNSHRRKEKLGKRQKEQSSADGGVSPFVLNEAMDMDEDHDEEAQQIQKWLKCNKCEDMDEVVNMWRNSAHYRRRQLRALDAKSDGGLAEFLSEWPAYKLPAGHLLVNIDFGHLHPQSEAAFRERWPLFMRKIVNLMEAELKDNTNVELFKQFKMARSTLNEDSKEATLLKLLHAITKPSRCFNTPQGSRRYCIAESQLSVIRMIAHASELDGGGGGGLVESHPCIYLVGVSILAVESCVVAYRDLRYELSFADALRTCFQLFATFGLDFPLASLNFWNFVRGYFFDINTEQDTSYAVMDNIVKYLETYNVDS